MEIQKSVAIEIGQNYPERIQIKTIGSKTTKFAGEVFLLRDGKIQRSLFLTEIIYNSSEEAKNATNEICKSCVEFFKKESSSEKNFSPGFGSDSSKYKEEGFF